MDDTSNGYGRTKLSRGEVVRYGGMLFIAGVMWASLTIQVKVLGEAVASQKADIFELRKELSIVNERYVALLVRVESDKRRAGGGRE